MCIKYEASSEKDMHKSGWMVPPRPNVPRDETKPSKEELEQRMSVLLPNKSPDKEECQDGYLHNSICGGWVRGCRYDASSADSKFFKTLTKHIVATFLWIIFLPAGNGDWEVTAFCNLCLMGGPWRILGSDSKQYIL